jgi:predicted glutamine amidotransferase
MLTIVNVYFSFFEAERSFEDLSRKNPDGWGIAWFDGFKWSLYKEMMPLYMSSDVRRRIKIFMGS